MKSQNFLGCVKALSIEENLKLKFVHACAETKFYCGQVIGNEKSLRTHFYKFLLLRCN